VKLTSGIDKLFRWWWFILLPGIILVAIAANCGGGGSGNVGSNVGGSATLSWDAPQTYVDGRPLGDALGGFKVYYGTSSRNYTHVVDVGKATTYKVTGLSPATYYFAVTAYDRSGNESDYSNEVSKEIR
jgi:fibronectin type 3 domain-containing protein